MNFQLKIIFIILSSLIFIINLQPIVSEWKIPNPISSNNFVEYVNYTEGYSILYPYNWEKTESKHNTTFYPELHGNKSSVKIPVYVTITNTSLPNVPLNLEAIVHETIYILNSTLNNFKTIESNNFFLGADNYDISKHIEGHKLVYSYEKSNNIIKKMEIGFIVNNNLILISFHSDIQHYNAYLPTVEKMIESLNFEFDVNRIDFRLANIVINQIPDNANNVELILAFDIYNPTEKYATTSKIEYDLFGDNELLGHGVLSYEDIPLNGRPQFSPGQTTTLKSPIVLLPSDTNMDIIENLINNPSDSINSTRWKVNGTSQLESAFVIVEKDFSDVL